MKKAFKILGGLIFALALWDAWLVYFHIPGWKPAFVSTSPDGRFSVSVYYNPGILPLPSGLHPRDFIGTVVLRENRTGKVLQRERSDIADASGEPTVRWYSDSVSVVSVDVWDLPPEEPGE